MYIVATSVSGGDQVTLGGGADTLIVGAANDYVNASAGGADSIDLGIGNDTVEFTSDMSSADTVLGDIGTDLLTYTDTSTGSGDELNNVYDIERVVVLGTGINLTLTDSVFSATAGSGAGSDATIDASGGFGLTLNATNESISDLLIIGTGLADSVTLGGGSDAVSLGDGNDYVNATKASDDSINLGGGNDTVVFGSEVNASDTIQGGTGDVDVLTYTDLTSMTGDELNKAFDMDRVIVIGENVNLVITNTLFSESVSAVSGSSATIDASTATGNTFVNASAESSSGIFILAAGGNDTIRGGAGSDVIIAGNGDNKLIGGRGSDSIVGGTGADLFVVDTIDATAGDLDQDSYIGGTGGQDTLVFNSIVDGSEFDLSNDYVSGIEVFSYGEADPSVSMTGAQAANADVVSILGSVSTTDRLVLTSAATVSFVGRMAGIESILGSGGNDSIVGPGYTLVIAGGAGNDTLVGTSAGGDSLYGEADNDLLIGASGNDVYNGGTGNDVIDARNGGIDTLTFGDDNDLAIFGDKLNASDVIDGAGSGLDSVSYTDVSSTGGSELDSATDIEYVSVMGSDSVVLTLLSNSVMSAGATINASGASSAMTLNASVDTDGLVILGTNDAAGDVVTLGSGNDVLMALAGTDLVIATLAGADSISLGDGNDTVVFGTAVDSSDTVQGGADTDVLTYTDATSATGSELNNVYDIERLKVSGDNINLTLTDSVFSATAGNGVGSDATIDASAGTGLTLNANNETSSDLLIIATSTDDFVTLGGGSDAVSLGDGSDYVNAAHVSNDSINLGNGDDTVVFGEAATSFDTVLGDSGTDVLVYTDVVSTGGSELNNVYDIERVVVSGNNINLTLTDSVFSATAGVLVGSDATIDASAGTGLTLNANNETSSDLLIIGTGAADSVTLGGGSDALSLGNGADYVDASYASDDSISLGNDADLVAFGNALNSADTVVGGSGPSAVDTLTFTDANNALSDIDGVREVEYISISGTAAAVSVGSADVLSGTVTIDASSADSISFNASAENTDGIFYISSAQTDSVVGTGAADRFEFAQNLTGSDTVIGGAGVDTLRFEDNNSGVNDLDDVRQVELVTISGGASTIVLGNTNIVSAAMTVDGSSSTALSLDASVEDLNALRVFGGAGADSIIGTQQADTISTGAEADTLVGGLGNDLMLGEAGNDIFRVAVADATSTAADTFSGGSEMDKILLDGPGSYDLTGDSINSVELIDFSSGDQTVTLSVSMLNDSGLQTVDGGSGNDALSLGGSPVIINLGLFNKTLVNIESILGSAGNDSIIGTNTAGGAQGADSIYGMGGNDTIDGSSGNDYLSGGDGDDLFILSALDHGTDTIDGGSETNGDSIRVDVNTNVTGLTITSIEAIIATGGTVTLTATQADEINRLIADDSMTDQFWVQHSADNQTVVASAGKDTIEVFANEADSLMGAAGDDVYYITTTGGGFTANLLDDSLSTNDRIIVKVNGTTDLTGLNAGQSLLAAGIDKVIADGQTKVVLSAIQANGMTLEVTDSINGGFSIVGSTGAFGAGDQVLSGSAGADTIEGGTGADTINGGAGNDIVVINTQGDETGDYLTGGDGYDVLRLDSTDTITGTVFSYGQFGDNFEKIHINAQGGLGDFDARILSGTSTTIDGYDAEGSGGSYPGEVLSVNIAETGTVAIAADFSGLRFGSNWIDGADDLVIYGTQFDDTVIGSIVADRIYGDQGNDSLMGMSGNDNMNGGGGLDTLVGGVGVDVLNGDEDNDVYRYDSVSGAGGWLLGNAIEDQIAESGNNNTTSGFDKVVITNGAIVFGSEVTLVRMQNVEILETQETGAVNHNIVIGSDLKLSSTRLIDLDATDVGGTASVNGSVLTSTAITISGTQGNDTLFGGMRADSIEGNDGHDILRGALEGADTAADTLVGGEGNDTFAYSSELAFIGDSIDAMYDTLSGGNGTDVISITGSFTIDATDDFRRSSSVEVLAAGTSSSSLTFDITLGSDALASDLLTVNLSTNTNSASTSNVDLSALTVAKDMTVLGLSNGSDTVVGGGGNDTIVTFAGNDSVDASFGGNDSINLGTGNNRVNFDDSLSSGDVVIGADGTDTLTYRDLGAVDELNNVSSMELVSVVGAGADIQITLGADSIFSANATLDASQSAYVMVLDANVDADDMYIVGTSVSGGDSVTLGGGADTLIAGAGNDVVDASFGGNDSINLGTGNNRVNFDDSLSSGDVVIGADGTDTLTYRDLGAVDELNNVSSMELVSVVGAGADIQITLGADSIFSANATLDASQSAYVMVLDANVDADDMYIVGTSVSGGDSVTLGGGADTLIAGAGNDVVDASFGGNDSINLGTGNNRVNFDDSLSSGDVVIGADGTDTLTYRDLGAVDELNNVSSMELVSVVGAGADIQITLGADSIFSANATLDASQSAYVMVLDANVDADDMYIVGTSVSGGDSVTLGGGADTLIAGAGNDVVDASFGGNDSINLGTGNNRVNFDDSLSSGDVVIGADGTDTLTYRDLGAVDELNNVSSMELVSVVGAGADIQITLGADSIFSANATLDASQSAYVMVLDANVDADDMYIVGTSVSGGDSVTLGGGADTLIAGAGNDVVDASFGGNDSINLGTGNNRVNFDDSLSSGDVVIGADGTDTLTYRDLGAVDELNNVSSMELVSVVGAGADIQITLGADSIFSANATLDASQSAYVMVLDANVDADDMYIVGTSVSGGDSVTLGGGADTLIAGAGDDYVNASAGGADRIDLGANNDTVGFATFAGMNAAETVVGGSGTDKAFVYAAGTLVDADLTDLTSIEILRLTGANTLTIGSEATDAGLSTIEAGAGNTNISSSMSTVTLDADVMADNALLSISGASSSANFVVSNLEANFNSENVSGNVVLNLGNVTDNASTLTLGAGNTTLSGGDASDTYVINATLESDILNAAGVVGDMSIVLGSGAQTIYGGMGVDTITTGAGTDRLEFSADSAKISNISAADTSDGAINAQITTITDYQQDVINFPGSETIAGANNGTAVNTNSDGFVTSFRNGEVNLWDRIQAVQSDEDLDVANTLAMFLHDGSTYVYYSGTATGNADDQIIRVLDETGFNQIVPGGSFYLDTAATFNWPITGTTLAGEKSVTGGPVEGASPAGYSLSSLSTRTLIDPNGSNAGWGTSIGNGDDYSVQVGITSIWSNGMNFFNPVGTVNYYNNLYMGSNGYVTFGRGYSGYTPQGIAGFTYAPMIAAQFDDLYTVDGRRVGGGSGYNGISTGSGTGYYYVDTTLNRVVFTWDNVGLYSSSSGSSSGTNGDGSAFQIILQRLGAAGSRDFSIEIRYEDVNYQYSNATAGWTAGDRTNYQLVDNDATAGYSLLNAVSNSNIGVAGVWAWNVVGGVISSKYWLPDVDPQGTGSTGEPVTQVVNADLQSGLANLSLYRFYLSGDDGGRFTVDSVSGIVSSVADAKWNLWKEDYKDNLTQVSVYGAYTSGSSTTRTNDKEFTIDLYESGKDPVKRINDTALSIGGSVYLTDLNDAADTDLLTVTSISAANAGSAAMLDLSNQQEGFTIRGSAYGDSIVGSSQTNAAVDSLDGADVIYGGGGNDTLVGHDSDVLFGGANDDLFVISANTVVVTELVGEGTDTVSVSGLDLSSFGAFNHIEAVAFTSDVTLTGAQADSLSAIYGGAGASDALHLTSSVNISGDAISGIELVYLTGGLTVSGSQADAFGSIVGTAGTDTLSLTTSGDISGTELSLIERLDLTANVTLDGAQANALTTMVGSAGANAVYLADSINAVVGANMASNIESLFGSIGGDSLTAASVRYIDGGAGNDYLTGGAGADTLLGGANNDTLLGSTGDSLLGGAGDDLFIIENGASGFKVSDAGSNGSDTLSVGGSVDLSNADLAGIEYLIVDGAVSLKSSQSAGFTSVVGADGSSDDAVYLVHGDQSLVGANFSGIESLFGGIWADRLIATNVHYINGLGGDDSIVGDAAFADMLIGLDGNDTLVGQSNDTLDAGANSDWVIIANGSSGFSATGDGLDTLSVGGSINLTGAATGFGYMVTDGGVSLTGAQANAFTTIYGASGSTDDVVYLTASVNGAVGNNLSGIESLFGSAGVDTLYATNVHFIDGMGGNDIIYGSVGDDVLKAGSGADLFVLNASGNAHDTILGWETVDGFSGALSSGDILDITMSDAILDIAASSIESSGGAVNVTGSSSGDMITGGVGNDTFTGGLGGDTLTGGAGNDLFVIDSGTDYILDLGGHNPNPNADESDVIQVASGRTLYATVTDDWTATSATRNDGGLVYLTAASLDASGAVDGIDIDLSSVTLGSAGYVLDARGTDTVSSYVVGSDTFYAGDWLFGSSLSDTFYGSANGDWIKGNNGDDYILAGGGADTVEGGVGNDTIAFLSWLDVKDGITSLVDADSVGGTAEKLLGARNLDQIVWLSGDKIDLSGIDASTADNGDQAFTFALDNTTASPGTDAIADAIAGQALLQTGLYISTASGSFTHTAAGPGGPDGLLTLYDGTNIVRIVIIGGGALSSSDLIL
jgi:Ca2+-binding RTX toxin-like protein